jgi:hypothetical protein
MGDGRQNQGHQEYHQEWPKDDIGKNEDGEETDNEENASEV